MVTDVTSGQAGGLSVQPGEAERGAAEHSLPLKAVTFGGGGRQAGPHSHPPPVGLQQRRGTEAQPPTEVSRPHRAGGASHISDGWGLRDVC